MDIYVAMGLLFAAVAAWLYRQGSQTSGDLRPSQTAARPAAEPTPAPRTVEPATWPIAGQTATGQVPGPHTLRLDAAGDRKIDAIKAVCAVTGVGLKQAKDLIEAPGSILLLRVDTPSANRAEALFIAAGMQVTRT